MNWGNRILISFLVFGAIMTSMVIISMQQNIDLVADNYYEKEIDYQSQIDRMSNFKALGTKPSLVFEIDKKVCKLLFPEEIRNGKIEGTIRFFRPSDASVDQVYSLSMDEGEGFLWDLEGMIPGLWNVQVEWSDGDMSYYFEEVLFL